MANSMSITAREKAVATRARELGFTVVKHADRFLVRSTDAIPLTELEDLVGRLDGAAREYAKIEALEAALEPLSETELAAELRRHLWTVDKTIVDDVGTTRLTDGDGYVVSRRDLSIAGLRWLLAELRYLDSLLPDDGSEEGPPPTLIRSGARL